MKVEINDETPTLYAAEVVEQLEACGALQLRTDEHIKGFRLECGCDLEIDIEDADGDERTETLTESDIRAEFVNADYCTWAQDENGVDILPCFGAC